MSIQLTPKHEKIVRQKMKAGGYRSESAVIGEALKALNERDERKKERTKKLAELRRKVDAGIADIENGRYIELDSESLRPFLEDICRRGRERLERRRKKAARA